MESNMIAQSYYGCRATPGTVEAAQRIISPKTGVLLGQEQEMSSVCS